MAYPYPYLENLSVEGTKGQKLTGNEIHWDGNEFHHDFNSTMNSTRRQIFCIIYFDLISRQYFICAIRPIINHARRRSAQRF